MLYTLRGIVEEKGSNFFILEVGGIGFKIFTNARALKNITITKTSFKCFCFLHVSESQFTLFGFLNEPSLLFFELLNTVPGVGPRTALNVLDVDSIENITAAILEKRTDLLTRASGIGTKTAERIVIELQSKLHLHTSSSLTQSMDMDIELEEALVSLGYQRRDAKQVIHELTHGTESFESRLRDALKKIGKSK